VKLPPMTLLPPLISFCVLAASKSQKSSACNEHVVERTFILPKHCRHCWISHWNNTYISNNPFRK
jgi:hypothetical protein